MFTDRFLKVPIELFDRTIRELTNNNEENNIATTAKLNPFEISHYYPQPDENDKLTRTMVWFKDGESLLVFLHIDDFEKRLNSFGEK